jgi:hypothetical protein
LDEAMALSPLKMRLLLGTIEAEKAALWDHIEVVLGNVWDMEDLVSDDKGPGSNKVPAQVRVPVLTALAGDFFARLSERYKKKLVARREVPDGALDGATLSKNEWKSMFGGLNPDSIPFLPKE